MGGIGGALISAGINLADDALFATLDVAGSYKSLGEAGLEFGKKAACALVNVGAQGLFGGFAGKMVDGKELTTGIFGASKGIFSSVKTDTLSGVIGKTIATGLQTVTTSVATSAINAFNIQYDEYGNALGLGWSGDAFSASVQGGLISAATSMTSTFTSGYLNITNATEELMMGFSSANVGDIMGLNGFLGSMAGQAMNYALTGTASFNALNFSMFGLTDKAGSTVGGGLLELNFGKNGFSSRLGMGGADVSLGTLATALRGLDVWNVNNRISAYGNNNDFDALIALRAQYGFGDAAQKAQLSDILAGRALIRTGSAGNEDAQTILENGRRVITLANYQESMSDAEQMKLAITLGHEAYRDGIDNGTTGQNAETVQAVKKHTEMMIRMGADPKYQKLMNSVIFTDENLRNDFFKYMQFKKDGNEAAYENYVNHTYDASADYWLVKLDGTIEDTEERAFFYEYIDADGIVQSEKVVGSEYAGSKMLALYNFLGTDMIKKMYEKSPSTPDSVNAVPENLYSYSDEVITDVLGWSAEQIKAARKDGINLNDLTDKQRQKLVIEQLLVQNGYTFGNDFWSGNGMKVPGLLANESIGIRLVNGQWERFTAGMVITRDADAYDVWKNNIASNDYAVKDSADVSFYKRNLDTGTTEWYYGPTSNWASIDKMTTDPTTVIVDGNTYQGNTLISEWFKMHLIDYPIANYGVANVGVFTDAQILSDTDGTQILTKAGRRTGFPNDARWLFHPFGTGASSDGCIGPMSNFGFDDSNKNWRNPDMNGSGAYYMQQVLNQLMNQWGIYKGYEFSVHLLGQRTPTVSTWYQMY